MVKIIKEILISNIEHSSTKSTYKNNKSFNVIDIWLKTKNLKELSKIIGIQVTRSSTYMRELMPYIIKEFIVLLSKGTKIIHISEKLGCDRKSLNNWEKKYDLTKYRVEQNKSLKKAVIDPYLLVEEYITMKNNIRVLEKKLSTDSKTIRRKLLEIGFIPAGKSWSHVRSKVKNHVNNSGYSFPIPEHSFFEELVIGSLLGDGCIYTSERVKDRPYSLPHTLSEYNNAIRAMKNIQKLSINENNINYTIKIYNQSVEVISSFPVGIFKYRAHYKETPWVDFIANEFENLGMTTNRYMTKFEYKEIDSGGNIYKAGDQWGFESSGSVELARIYYDWYYGNEHSKCIPRSLIDLTPNILLFWFVGDGSFSKSYIVLYTNSFTKDDNNYLVSLFLKIGIKVKIGS